MNEKITEDIVRDHFKKDVWYDRIHIEEQISKIPRIDKLLKTASKSGDGVGKPEFIITFKKETPDYIIIIECKADVTKHESKTRDNYRDYAVDGVLLYSSYLSKEYDILSIAASGEDTANLKISHFLQLKGETEAKSIFGDKLLSIESYLTNYKKDERKYKQEYEKLLKYSATLNDKLHALKIKESQRSLLLSGILIALDDKHFRDGYKIHDEPKDITKDLVDTIEKRLKKELISRDKTENLAVAYSFIKTHTALSQEKDVLKDLIDDIDNNINSFIKTYRYHDILGELYIEFLQYSNNDKGLGIVLTPRHIADFFSDIAMVNKNSVILDNCGGTGGFLISGMKRMIEDAKGDNEKIKIIKNKQVVGIEYQDDIFTLLCSNMFIQGDGKSSMIHGSCFDEKIMKVVREEFKPNIGFLNPPYKTEKTDPYELEFILNNINMLEKGGICVAIVPMSCVLAQKGKELELKKKILEYNTLDAVFSMPNDLFVNSGVGTVTCVVVIRVHQPHPSNYETYFGYCKEDGFIKRKLMGRGDYLNKWNGIRNQWIYNYRNKKEIPEHSIKRYVTADDEWCAEAYMETDYSKITKEDFVKTIKDFVLFQEMFLK